jgi:hypothetical protein
MDARFDVRLDVPAQGNERASGTFFQLTSADTSQRRARVLFRASGRDGYELGVSNAGGRVSWALSTFKFGQSYRVIVDYNLENGFARLWV